MPKKIVILGTAHPLRGGLAAYNERLAKAFLERGDEVLIYTFSLQYPGFLFPGKTQYSGEPPPEGLNIKVKVNSINLFNWYKTGKEIARLKPDLLIVKFWIPFMAPCLGTIARLAKKNKHTKVISIIDNIIPHEKRPGDRVLAKYWVNSVDGFIVMAKAVEEELKQFTTSKPIIYNPHPLYDNFGEIIPKQKARERLGLEPEGKYILFFGFIRDYKGLDILLDAMADERIKKLGVKLIVAGEFYTSGTPYLEQIKALKIQDSVLLHTDFIPDSKVGLYFSSADVVVQPYKTATQSGVTQICYHFEKPVITTNVGGLPEIVKDGRTGFIVNPEPKEIADAVYKFYSSAKEQEMLPFIREEKKYFSWENLLKNIDVLSKEIKSL